MLQINQSNKNTKPQKKNKTKANCLLNKEFKVLVIKMLIKLYRQVENFYKDIKL